MRWITKAALVCFGLSMVFMVAVQFGWEQGSLLLDLSFTLALILTLLAILETPGPEGNSYLFSILTGIAVGFIVGYLFFTKWTDAFSVVLGSSIEKDEIPTQIFVSNVPPILVMIYSLLLSRMYPYAWKEIRVRLISIALLLLAYTFGSYFGFVSYVVSYFGFVSYVPYTVMMFPSTFIALLFNGIISWTEKIFLYSNIVTIAAAYIATIGIKDLRRRAILALGLILLMSIVAS